MSLKQSGRPLPAVFPEIVPLRAASPDERSEDFLRAAADWIWESDAQLRLTELGRAATAALGLPAQLLLGQALPQLATADPESDALLALLRRRQPFRNRRFRLRRPGDGIELVLLLSGVPYFDAEQGRFAGYRGTGSSDRLAGPELPFLRREDAAEALAREVERLSIEVCELRLALQSRTEQSTAAEREDFARLGHELRSPLNAILGYAEFAQQRPYGPLPLRYQDCVERIATAARHLQRVIDGLGRDTPERALQEAAPAESCRLDQAVAEALSIVAIEAERRSIDCSAVQAPAAVRLRAEQAAVVQILVNLLGNAMKFSPEGGTVGIETSPLEGRALQIVVWDRGEGIPEALLGRIFEAGFRGASRAEGKGLGLAIARDLARRAGGDLRAENGKAGGARFCLTLPLAEQSPTARGCECGTGD